MLHAMFNWGLHSLPKYPFTGIQNEKGSSKPLSLKVGMIFKLALVRRNWTSKAILASFSFCIMI